LRRTSAPCRAHDPDRRSAGASLQSAPAINSYALWLQEKEIVSPDDPRTLSRGVTKSLRARFRKLGNGSPDELRSAYARARFDMGRVYWRRVDFVEAAHAANGTGKPEDRLLLALSLALAMGPNGAAEMMRAPTPTAFDLRATQALDIVAGEGGPFAGTAAYDAAHQRALAPVEGEGLPAYLKDVAARFRKAASLLSDPAQKKARSAARRGDRSDQSDGILTVLQ
jgi:hypothetical protein